MNLVIHAPLSEPPTESLPFRYVVSCANRHCEMNVLLECEVEERDLYWRFLKEQGMFDFVDDIISPFEEKGLRLDVERRNLEISVIVNCIRLENQVNIIEDIRSKAIPPWPTLV
jgi:hypothetical protein